MGGLVYIKFRQHECVRLASNRLVRFIRRQIQALAGGLVVQADQQLIVTSRRIRRQRDR